MIQPFIVRNEIRFFLRPLFRKCMTRGAYDGDITCTYYLKQIFELFSEEEGDFASIFAFELDQNLKRICEKTILNTNTKNSVYDIGMAYFYQGDYENTQIHFQQELEKENYIFSAQEHRDVLHILCYITDDEKYGWKGIDAGYLEFLLYVAAKQKTVEDAFRYLT